MGSLLRRATIPLAIVLFAALVIVLAMQFRELPPVLRRGMQPAWFPVGVALLVMALAVLLFFHHETAPDADTVYHPRSGRTLAVVPLFVLLLQVDFLLALALSALFVHLLWARQVRWQALAFLGILMPAAIYALFGEALAVRFPRGLITNWLYG